MSIDEKAFTKTLEGIYDDPYDVTIKHHREFVEAYEAAKANGYKTLPVKAATDQPVDWGNIQDDFSELWKAIETVEHKLHDKYHWDLGKIKKSLTDAHRMCRPLWDKLIAGKPTMREAIKQEKPLSEQGCFHCNPIKRNKVLGDPRDSVSATAQPFFTRTTPHGRSELYPDCQKKYITSDKDKP